MGEVHTLTPRAGSQKSNRREIPGSSPVLLRSQIEEAAQHAIDTAEQLIAILDGMDGDTELEDGGDAEPSLGALEGRDSQIVWLRGTDRDLELTSPENR